MGRRSLGLHIGDEAVSVCEEKEKEKDFGLEGYFIIPMVVSKTITHPDILLERYFSSGRF